MSRSVEFRDVEGDCLRLEVCKFNTPGSGVAIYPDGLCDHVAFRPDDARAIARELLRMADEAEAETP